MEEKKERRTATAETTTEMLLRDGKNLKVDARQIRVLEGRGRKNFRNLDALSTSIQTYGLLHPLVVSKNPEGDEKLYTLIAGERRFKALLLLGRTSVPCLMRDDLTDIEQKEIELEENLRRENLEWSEEIQLIRQIDELKKSVHGAGLQGKKIEGTWTTEDTAELLGRNRGQISRQISFAKVMKSRPDLAEKVKDLPLSVAMKSVDKSLDEERLQRLSDKGMVKITTNLKQGLAEDLFKGVEDESVDLILTDPPFGIDSIIDLSRRQNTSSQSYATQMKDLDNADIESVEELFKKVIPEFFRVLKPSRHFYIFFSFSLYTELINTLVRNGLVVQAVPLIWDKSKPTSPFKGYDFMPCYEPILFGYKPPRERRLSSPSKKILNFSPVGSLKKRHVFQKPQSLLRHLIGLSSRLGETVLDPFAGSGATLLAAKALGRTGLGFEADKDHFLSASERLSKEKRTC